MDSDDPFARFTRHVLPNGLEIYLLHLPGKRSQYVAVEVLSGALQDLPGCEGTAHLVEHIVTESGGMSSKEMRSHFKRLKGLVNLGETGPGEIKFWFRLPAKSDLVSDGLKIFGRMLLQPEINMFAREKKIVAREFATDYPLFIESEIETRGLKAIFGHTPYAKQMKIGGDLESIKRTTIGDVRMFLDQHYVPANMVIVGIGGMPDADMIALIEQSLFSMKRPGFRQRLKDVPAPPPPAETEMIINLREYAADATGGRYATMACLPRSLNRYHVRLVRDLLEELVSDELREKHGDTYKVATAHHALSCFHFLEIESQGLDADGLSRVRDVVAGSVETAASDEELFEDARTELTAWYWDPDVKVEEMVEKALDDLSMDGRIIPYGEIIKTYETMTTQDVCEVLRHLAPDRRFSVLMTI